MKCACVRAGGGGRLYLQFPLLKGTDYHLQTAVAHVYKYHITRLLVLGWQILLVDAISKGSWKKMRRERGEEGGGGGGGGEVEGGRGEGGRESERQGSLSNFQVTNELPEYTSGRQISL